MILVEEGKVSLADPVAQYLPELKDVKVGIEKKDDSGGMQLVLETPQRAMTIHDLLRHTSGFTYGFFGKSLVKDQYNAAKVTDAGQTSAEFITKLASIPLQYHPGTTWECSVSTDVLGRIIEVVSGAPLDQFVAERVLAPLKMTDTGFWVERREKHGRIAEPQVDPATGKRPTVPDRTQKPNWLSGGGGMVSTAPDYARFCQFLLNGGKLDGARLLSRKTVEYMASDHLPLRHPGERIFGSSDRCQTRERPGLRARLHGAHQRGSHLSSRKCRRLRMDRHLRHPVLGGSEGADVRGDDAPDRHSCDARQVLDAYARPRVSGDRRLSVAGHDHIRQS
jgi:CubicO group peptidase (beta-lactamase class C family)